MFRAFGFERRSRKPRLPRLVLLSRGHREHNPKNDVSKKACPGKENGQQPHDADDRGIKVKIVCQTGAHAGNLLVGARAHQFLLATCLRRKAWRWSFRLLGAAVVAKP